jgi:AAHS family 4-hydroxybenzoate transporter-like MFS transporter
MSSTVDVAEWLDQRKVSALQILVLVLCAATSALDGFDAQVIGYVAPAIIADWHIPGPSLSPVFAAGTFGLLVGCLFFAPLADYLGRKRVIVASLVFFGIASLLTADARSLTMLMLLRFLTGLGLGGSLPNAIAMTAEYFPARNRATMTMVMFCGFPLGASIGGFLAAGLIPEHGWRAVFVVGGVLPLLLALLLVFALPESMRYLVAKGSETGRVAAILGRIDAQAGFSPATRFAIDEERASGLTVRHLFREGRALGTLLLWVMFFMSLLDIYLLSSWLPTVLHDAGLSISLAVVATALLQGGGVLAAISLGRVVDRYGFFAVLLPTYIAAAITIAAIGFTGTSIPLIMVAAFLSGACVIGGQTGVNVLAAVYYPTVIRATGVGWGLGIGRIGSIVGPLLGGLMLQLHWDRSSIFLAAAVPAAIVALAVFVMARTEPSTVGARPPRRVPVSP